jgi:phytoene desaturase
MDFVARNYDRITDLANPTAALRLVETRSYQRLYAQACRYFLTDKLRKAFTFHSMFLGLSPFDALAMYSLITYADLVEGMHYPMGGIYSIVEDMVALAAEMGVTMRTSAPVEEILVEGGRARGVRLAGGEAVMADVVVSNADLVYTYKKLVPAQHRRAYPDARLDRMEYACSGYLLYLGVDRTYPHMRHQALYFSEDYRANLDAIFRTKTLPADPSFHLNNPTITDPGLAPPGHSVLYMLAPMPNLQGNVDWDAAAQVVREKLLRGLEKLVDPEIRRHIVWEREYRPADWERDINAPYGVAFGSLSHGFFQSSYFRPHNIARDIPGLYFVGQGTYPGIGMPMVLLCAVAGGRLQASRSWRREGRGPGERGLMETPWMECSPRYRGAGSDRESREAEWREDVERIMNEITLSAATAEDYAECRRVMVRASKNYSFASRFLPRARQHHVEALYAFLRVGDDRVDVTHLGFASPLAAIEDWERAYWQAFETGRSDHPVMRAYLNTALERGIPAETMTPYFRAMKEDLTVTRPTFADLLHYMEGSAMVVGRAMTYILGVRPPYTFAETLPHADSLSIAMQLSNFWRDIGEDWGIGRVYIPGEDLESFGVTEADLAAARTTPQFIRLLEFEFERTEGYYRHARAGVFRLQAGRWGVMSGLEVYRAILPSIRRNGYDVFTHRAGASRLMKLGLALNAGRVVACPFRAAPPWPQAA